MLTQIIAMHDYIKASFHRRERKRQSLLAK